MITKANIGAPYTQVLAALATVLLLPAWAGNCKARSYLTLQAGDAIRPTLRSTRLNQLVW